MIDIFHILMITPEPDNLAVRYAVRFAVRFAVRYAVRYAVWSAVRFAVRYEVRSAGSMRIEFGILLTSAFRIFNTCDWN